MALAQSSTKPFIFPHNPTDLVCWRTFIFSNIISLKYDIGPPFWVHPLQRARPMSDHAFLDSKNHTTKSTWPLGVKGLVPISIFGPITSEDFKPLTQRIGLASRCKAALRTHMLVVKWHRWVMLCLTLQLHIHIRKDECTQTCKREIFFMKTSSPLY
jgi:hypothetical protein